MQQLEIVLHVSIEAPTFTKGGALAKAEIARLLKPHTATTLEAKVASVRARK